MTSHFESDAYFLRLCNSVASRSKCLSRKLGCVIGKDDVVLSTGYNGPPRGIPHCGSERLASDDVEEIQAIRFIPDAASNCPRKLLGYNSGTHLSMCYAIHAEENAIINAARNGVSVYGATLYLNGPFPCKHCMGVIINAGISEIVCEVFECYDRFTSFLIRNSDIKIRKFTYAKESPK